MSSDLVDSAAISENWQTAGSESPHKKETIEIQSVITSTESESTGVVGATDQEQGIFLSFPTYLDRGDTCHCCFICLFVFFDWKNNLINKSFLDLQ